MYNASITLMGTCKISVIKKGIGFQYNFSVVPGDGPSL